MKANHVLALMEIHIFGFISRDTMAMRESEIDLANWGLIKLAAENGIRTSYHDTTEKGKVFVKMLLDTPLPVRGDWVDPRKSGPIKK